MHVALDAPLPAQLAVGAGTAVFVAGWASEAAPLALVVDGEPQPLAADRMPRLDVLRALHPGEDPYGPGAPDGYRSGFWGLATVGPRAPGDEVVLAVRGPTGDTELGRIPVVALPTPVAWRGGGAQGPLVAICMATYEPPAELLRRQVASIRAQTHGNWVCVVSDDGSSAAGRAVLDAAVGEDPRFVVSSSGGGLGFYANFERALALAPREADFVALADQDDDWHPDKLATLLAAIGDAPLVYSDARVVTPTGELVSGTYWATRDNDHRDPLSLLVANAVTGAASLLRRDLLDDALPFPPAQFAHFHDHWLGLVATARGEIAYVDRPLYDYVQHDSASLGHAAANRMTGLRDRLGGLRADPRERVRQWRAHYFVDVCRLAQLVAVLRARLGPQPALERFVAAETSWPALGRLWARGGRELLRRRPRTLGAEWMLAYALSWRRLLGWTARDRPVRGLRLDAVPPATLAPAPGRPGIELPEVRAVEEKVRPLRLVVAADAPERVNLLVPTIDLEHFFGGYIGKLNLARRLAARGLRVRIVTVDPVGPLAPDWQATVSAYAGLDGVFDAVEVLFGREAQRVEVSPRDRFVATTWWTAHVADAAARECGRDDFLYLIQEYEPFTFPMGTWAALAEGSYRLRHRALFSTELLRGWFRERRIGVYEAGAAAGDAASAAFSNAITAVPPPAAAALRARTSRRLLLYARPEAHAARNLFELAIVVLREASRRGTLAGWELRGIGTTALGRRLDLGTGQAIELLPRSAQAAYGTLLAEHDVGLALMHTPHPSLVPLEMAAAGLVTVTTTFETKTAAALRALSGNLRAAEPAVGPLVETLAAAVRDAADVDARVAGAAVAWPRSWDDAFDAATLDRVVELLA